MNTVLLHKSFFSFLFFSCECCVAQQSESGYLNYMGDSESEYQAPERTPLLSETPSIDFEESDGYFSMLPDELCQKIFSNLDAKSFFALSHTCTRLYNVCLSSIFVTMT